MTTDPVTSERIDGEHHYAVLHGEVWAIKRKSDDVCVRTLASPTNLDAEETLFILDTAANHFIAQGREEALKEVDLAAEKLEGFRAELFYDEGGWVLDQYMNQEFRAQSFTEALEAATQSTQAEAGDGA